MKRETVLQILIAALVSLVGAAGVTQGRQWATDAKLVASDERMAAIDAREQEHNTQNEKALERVGRDADQRVDALERNLKEKIEAIHIDVQWLIKRALERESHDRSQDQ